MDDDNLVGLIPAAGKGVRLQLPYPKELYPVIRNNRYKPVAQFILENLVAARVGQLVFIINETKSQLIGYFGNGCRFNCHISYVVQETVEEGHLSRSVGLAHALDSAYHLVRGKTVLFGMPDTIIQPKDVFLQGLSALQAEDDGLLCLFPTQNPGKFGMVRSENGRALEIVDKPQKTDLQYMWGCILWKPRFTEFLHRAIHERGVYDFAQILNQAITAGLRFKALRIEDGAYLDLGTYEDILELDKRLRED